MILIIAIDSDNSQDAVDMLKELHEKAMKEFRLRSRTTDKRLADRYKHLTNEAELSIKTETTFGTISMAYKDDDKLYVSSSHNLWNGHRPRFDPNDMV